MSISLSAPGPDAGNTIRSRDGKKLLDEVIHLMDKNNKLGLVKLIENGENVKTARTSTLSLSDVAALGAGSTPFALSHSGSTSTFTVGGADHTALLR
ncbi:MAG: hypothetical protein ACLUGP_06220 [Faecalibacterium prausnitzii]